MDLINGCTIKYLGQPKIILRKLWLWNGYYRLQDEDQLATMINTMTADDYNDHDF